MGDTTKKRKRPYRYATWAEVSDVLQLLSRRPLSKHHLPTSADGEIIEGLDSNFTSERLKSINRLKEICCVHRDQRVLSKAISILYSIFADDVKEVRLAAINSLEEIARQRDLIVSTLVFSQDEYLESCFNMLEEINGEIIQATAKLLIACPLPKIDQVLQVAKNLIAKIDNENISNSKSNSDSEIISRRDVENFVTRLGRINAPSISLRVEMVKDQLSKWPLLDLGADNVLRYSITQPQKPFFASTSISSIKDNIKRIMEVEINAIIETVWGPHATNRLNKHLYQDLLLTLNQILLRKRKLMTKDALNATSILRTWVECAKFAVEERISKYSSSFSMTNNVQRRADLVLRHLTLADKHKRNLMEVFRYPTKPNFPSEVHLESSPVSCTIEHIQLTKPLIKDFPARLLATLIVHNCPIHVRQNFCIMLDSREMKESKSNDSGSVTLKINAECWSTSKLKLGQDSTSVSVDVMVPKGFCPSEVKVIMMFPDYEPWCCLASRAISGS